jgi:hypothetical protein
MPHRRTEIRNAVAALLTVTGAFTTVSKSRVHRAQDNELPAVLVYTLHEKSEPITLKRMLNRQLSLVIEIRVAATHSLDDRIDALCLAAETAMAADPKLGLLIDDSILDSTQIGLNGEGDLRHGVALLTYGVTYRTAAGNPVA